jgi:hypothetical protein
MPLGQCFFTIGSAVQPVPSPLSNGGSFPGEAVNWLLTVSSFNIMNAWNASSTHAVYFLVRMLIQTDRFLKIKHNLDKCFCQIKHCILK